MGIFVYGIACVVATFKPSKAFRLFSVWYNLAWAAFLFALASGTAARTAPRSVFVAHAS
jgi:hypothetical protein